jgi:hypothetical protein
MHQITELDKKGLREFGLISGAIVAILLYIVLPIIRHHSLSILPWLIAGVLWIWALLAPATLNLVYQIWMRIGLVLGWIQTRVILGVVLYIIIVPMGLMKRLLNQSHWCEASSQTYLLIAKAAG